MNDTNGSSGQLFAVLSRLKSKRDKVEREFKDRLAEIDREIEAVNTTVRLLTHPEDSEATTHKAVYIPASAITGKTHREALAEIARRNGGIVKASEARKLLIEAGKMKNTKSSWAMVYTTLSRSPEFTKVSPGVFRLESSSVQQTRLLTDK